MLDDNKYCNVQVQAWLIHEKLRQWATRTTASEWTLHYQLYCDKYKALNQDVTSPQPNPADAGILNPSKQTPTTS